MLAPQDNWECIEIQLPNKPNNLITDWVERSLERQIQAPAITLSYFDTKCLDVSLMNYNKNTQHNKKCTTINTQP